MTDISIRQIEVFLSVAKHRNISRAAGELFISQPSLSKSISTLEKEYGAPLFRRTNRGVVLTEEGEELYARLDYEYQRFRVNVDELFNARRFREERTLRIGALNRQTVVQVASEQTEGFTLQKPDCGAFLERYDFHTVLRKLLCRELDLVFTLGSEVRGAEELDFLSITGYPVFFITPPAWSAGLEALSGRTLLIESVSQRSGIEEICRGYGIVPSDVRYVSSYALLTTLVAREEGFAVDGKLADMEEGALPVSYLPARRAYYDSVVLAWRRDDLSHDAKEFVEFLRPRE